MNQTQRDQRIELGTEILRFGRARGALTPVPAVIAGGRECTGPRRLGERLILQSAIPPDTAAVLHVPRGSLREHHAVASVD